jgi:hypothetical protein
MKRLSGMMRIYIILSALYFLVSATFAMLEVSQSQSNVYQAFRSSCKSKFDITRQQAEYRDCVDDAHIKSKALNTERRLGSVLAYSILPLLLFWALGFACLKLYRWVKVGFTPQSSE